MKTRFLFVFFVLFSMYLSAHPFAGGDGTKENPYLIATAEQLDSMRWYMKDDGISKLIYYHWRLVTDIDMDIYPYNKPERWWPNFQFWGYFNGAGYQIRNLYGLSIFSCVDAVIDSLNIVDCDVSDMAIYINWFDRNAERRISNCSITGKIYGSFGIRLDIGNAFNLTEKIYKCVVNCDIQPPADDIEYKNSPIGITWGEECSIMGNITGYDKVSGFYGSVKKSFCAANIISKKSSGASLSGNLEQCYSIGTIRGDSMVGGITRMGGNVHNCYVTADIYGIKNVGGIVGYATVGGGNITNCYFSGNIYNTKVPDGNNFRIGGIVGYYGPYGWTGPWDIFYKNDSITDCVVMGNICPNIQSANLWQNPSVGRIVGKADEGTVNKQKVSVRLRRNYALDSSYIGTGHYKGTTTNDYGANQTIEVLRSQYFYENVLKWDFDTVWKMCDEIDYPIFQWQECGTSILENFPPKVVNDIKLYPNPVNTEISCEIELNQATNIKIDIIDLEGKDVATIYEGYSDSDLFHKTIQIPNIASGSYMLQMQFGKIYRYAKFIKK